jgi:hypothetical protein
LNDYYFITKSNLLNAKYKILLYYFDCKNKDKNDFCLGQALTRNIIQSHEYIYVNELKDGLYGIEVNFYNYYFIYMFLTVFVSAGTTVEYI